MGSDDITVESLSQVLAVAEPQLTDNVRKIFSALVDCRQDPKFVSECMEHVFYKLVNSETPSSHFERTCVSAGIVEMVKKLLASYPNSKSHPEDIYRAQCMALQLLWFTMQRASPELRGTMVDEMLSSSTLDVILQNLDHDLHIFQCLSIILIHRFAANCALGGKVSTDLMGAIIVALCHFALRGPGVFVEQSQRPELYWQADICVVWRSDTPAAQIPLYASKYWAVCQEAALLAVGDILLHSPIVYLYMLQNRPEVFDLLFRCTVVPLTSAYPESRVHSAACEALAMLIRWPLHVIPGVSTSVECVFEAKYKDAMRQTISLFASGEDWVRKLVDSWMMTVDHQHILRLVEDVDMTSHPCLFTSTSKTEMLRNIASHRGRCRTSLLRFIATLTHFSESCGIATHQIQSLLHITYEASRKPKVRTECRTNAGSAEHAEEAGPSGQSTENALDILTGEVDPPLRPSENMMGPTALARLLVVLAQRKILNTIQEQKTTPAGMSPSTSLEHVQLITRPDVIRRFFKVALQRVKDYTESGRIAVRNSKYFDAQANFVVSAELAVALVALDAQTGGQYKEQSRGARREIVIALGNAAEMALRQGSDFQALNYAQGAIETAEKASIDEGLDPTLTEKNKRRAQIAEARLRESLGMHTDGSYAPHAAVQIRFRFEV